ncbi:FHA domain-containing protein [Polyangium fumosum]|uniref:FHA domain-containing protein n=1 Tax=Polyangium fumosum TaxID=889272 RepID=UPI0014786137|nr:FHA domain-containing protein [Polyangium fumosum]
MHFRARVLRVVGPGRLHEGELFDLPEGAVIGRDPGVEVRLDHPSVSRRHARITAAPRPSPEPPLRIENLSSSSGLFVDGARLGPGDACALAEGSRLQIGAVLLEVLGPAETEPFCSPIPLDDAPLDGAAAPVFVITRDGDACGVQFAGRYLDLQAAAARAFAALAASPSQVVHVWDIQEAVGTAGVVAPLVTAIRRAVKSLLDDGALDEALLRGLIAQSGSGDRLASLESLDRDALLRRLVLSRRGHGYVLCLPPDAVRIVDAG